MSAMHSSAKTCIRQYAANAIGNPGVENKFLNAQASVNCATGRRYRHLDRSRGSPERRE